MVEAGWLVLAAALPLALNGADRDLYESPKVWLLHVTAGLMAAAALVRIAEGFDWRARFRDGAARRVAIIALLYAAWTVVALALSPAPWPGLFGIPARGQGAVTILAYVAVFLAAALCLREQSQVRRLVAALIYGSVPVAGLALLEAVGIEPFPALDPMLHAFPVRSTLGQHSFLAAYLILVMPFTVARLLEPPGEGHGGRGGLTPLVIRFGLPIALWAAVVAAAVRGAVALWWAVIPCALLFPHAIATAPPAPRWLARAACAAALALQIAALAGSQGRGPWLGLGAGLLVALVLGLWLAPRHRRGLAALMAGFAVAALMVVLLNIPKGPLAGFKATHPLVARLGALWETEAGSPGGVRLAIWKSIPAGAGLTADGPPHATWVRLIAGYGPDGQLGVMPFVLPAPLARVRHPDTEGREISFDIDRAHNDLLDHLLTVGAVGLALFVALLAAALWAGLALLRRGKYALWVGAALVALVAHAVELQTGVAITATRALFWLVAALIVAAFSLPARPAGHIEPAEDDGRDPGAGPSGARSALGAGWRGDLLALAAAGAGLAALLLGGRLLPGQPILPLVVMTGWVLVGLGALAMRCAPEESSSARAPASGVRVAAALAAAIVIGLTGMNFLGAVHFGTGREYALRAQWGISALEYESAVGRAPWEDSYWEALGEVYAAAAVAPIVRDRGRLLARARDALETARALNRASVRARRSLARLYGRAGPALGADALLRAEAIYREVDALQPRDAGLFAERAEVALRRGVPKEAGELAAVAIALDPSLWSAHAIRARVAFEAGDLEAARAAAAEAETRVTSGDRARLERFLQGLR